MEGEPSINPHAKEILGGSGSYKYGTREVAQHLKALAAHAKNLGPVTGTHISG